MKLEHGIFIFGVICLALFALTASADVTVSAVRSNHTYGDTYSDYDKDGIVRDYALNDEHYILSYYNPSNGLYAGYLTHNSYGKETYVLGKRVVDRRSSNGLALEFMLGVARGYEDKLTPLLGSNISPYGWVGVSYVPPGQDRFGITVRGVPRVITFAIDWKVW